MTFASSKVLAVGDPFPWVPLNISATVEYCTNSPTTNSTTIKSASFTTVAINNKSIIAMLNKFGPTNIPAGSEILWNLDYEDLLITNKNGFSYYPEDFYIEPDEYDITGQYSYNDTTRAGSESDLTGAYFYFYFNSENYLEAYGLAALNWTYGAESNNVQKATLSATLTFQGSDDSYIDDNEAEITSWKASGSASTMDPVSDSPYYVWEY